MYDSTLDPISPDFNPYSWGLEAGDALMGLIPAPQLAAALDPEAPAKIAQPRTRLSVPLMAPEKGDACMFACLPDSIEKSCMAHSGYQPA